jgi:hypothetical protein
MSAITRRKCPHCGQLFLPDARNFRWQRYCTKPPCRKASKADSQQRWLQKPENRDYFRGPEHVARVQRWRAAHPGYWRRPKGQLVALQDPLMEQAPVNTQQSDISGETALQDLLILQPAVLIGLIAQLTGSTLQDDIALATRRMQQLGNDILYPQPKGDCHGKTIVVPPAAAKVTAAVQLDRPAAGAR